MANEDSAFNNNQPQETQKKPDQQKDIWPIVVLGGIGAIFCICILVGAIFLSKYARPYLETVTIVLEPDYSKVSSVDPADLKKAAQILTERCDYMGCKSVSFVVSDDGQIIGKIPTYLDLNIESLVTRITAIGLLEFTDFGKTPVSEGSVVTTDFEHPFLPQVEGTTRHTIMTNHEIASVNVTRDTLGRYVIDFTLTEQGAKIFFEYTSENVGSYLGIVLDKTIISVPQVNSAIEGGSAEITGDFTEESAENLAAYLKIAPLPIPIVVAEISSGDQ